MVKYGKEKEKNIIIKKLLITFEGDYINGKKRISKILWFNYETSFQSDGIVINSKKIAI